MAEKLYFARDFKPRGFKSGPRCWFLAAESLEEAKVHMDRYVEAERLDRHQWFAPAGLTRGTLKAHGRLIDADCTMSQHEISEALSKPVALTDQSEAAAWVSRIEGRQAIYDAANNVWTVVVGAEEWARLIEPDAALNVEAKMHVHEISIENGFRQEEIDIGWKRALYSRLSAE